MSWTDSAPTEGPFLAERYRVVSRIGEGGMAGVYRAWDNRLRVWRAVKVLLPEFARKGKLRRRFEREAHTMARLEHRNLVRVVDVGTSGALPFIVMELVPCGTLMQWVERNGPMPEKMCIDVMVQVAEGLVEVHQNGVIHRDIKPHNVLINEQGLCKITDFGIAQEAEEGLTRAGSVMGTMGYMAPEQRNDASGVDQRADVYGFGATMWKLVTGRPLRDLFMYTEDPSIMEGIDGSLAEVLMACLSYLREDRPKEVSEVIDALRAVRDGLPDDPPGTKPLPLKGQLEGAEQSSNTFAEIASAFNDDGLPAPPEEGPASPGAFGPSLVDSGPKSSSTLPYGLPGRMEAPPEAVEEQPSWLVGEDDPATDESFEIRPDMNQVREAVLAEEDPPSSSQESQPGQRTKEEEDAVRPTYISEPEAPRPEALVPQMTAPLESQPEPPAEVMSAADIGNIIRIVAVLMVLGVAVIAGLGFWSRSSVVGVAAASDEATIRLYTALAEERNVATELLQFDRGASTLQGLYLDYADHQREPERWQRAMVFLGELDHYGKTAASSSGGSSAAQKVQRLRGARLEAVAAREAYYNAAWSFPGALAVGVGLAPSPSFDAESFGGS